MTANEKFREILQRLLEKSRAGNVKWGVRSSNILGVQFDRDSQLVVAHGSPDSAPDWASASLYIGGDKVMDMSAEDGDEDWELLNSLYLDAVRCVRGFGDALNKIEQALQSNETIGLT